MAYDIVGKVSAASVMAAIALTLIVWVAVAKKPENPGVKPPKDPPTPANPEITYVKVESAPNGTHYDLYVMDADGGNQTLIAAAKKIPRGYQDPSPIPQAGFYDPAWSPDENQIVVIEEDATDLCQGEPGWWQMKVLDIGVIDGEPQVLHELTIIDCNHIATKTNLRQPTWSPEGDTIVFLYGDEIRTIAPDGINNSVLLHRAPDDYPDWIRLRDVAWNGDGTKIAYKPHDSLIRVVDVATADWTEVMPPGNYVFSNIDWSYHSNWIIFGGHQADLAGGYVEDSSIWKFDPSVGVSSTIRVKQMSRHIGELNWDVNDENIIFDSDVGGEYSSIWNYTIGKEAVVLAAERRNHLREVDM